MELPEVDEVGPLHDRAVLAVRLRPGVPVPPLQPRPCVLVGVADEPVDPPPGFDVLLTEAPRPPRPWVAGDLGALTAACDASPEAAVVLVQLLRLSADLDPVDGLVAESLAYGLLQAGPHHRAWLADRPTSRRRPEPEGDAVTVERDGPALTVTLDRPAMRNAYGVVMRDGLVAALDLARADPSVTEVHLRGAGPAFCTGGHLDEFGTTPDPVTAHLVRTTRSAAARLVALGDRVTAHVHGPCVGAGTELAAFAGRVVAAEGTTFRLPEVGMGLVPGAGGTVSVPRRIGRHRAAWLALTGTELDHATALDWGLADGIDGGRSEP